MNPADVWRQTKIPVVYRPPEGSLNVKLPYAPDNFWWLKGDRHRYPIWIDRFKCWRLPRAWFNPVVDQCLERFGKVYAIQPMRELEKCAPACWNAEGHICECSCMGKNHGAGHPEGNWYEISETCAVQWQDRTLNIRLLIASDRGGERSENAPIPVDPRLALDRDLAMRR